MWLNSITPSEITPTLSNLAFFKIINIKHFKIRDPELRFDIVTPDRSLKRH